MNELVRFSPFFFFFFFVELLASKQGDDGPVSHHLLTAKQLVESREVGHARFAENEALGSDDVVV